MQKHDTTNQRSIPQLPVKVLVASQSEKVIASANSQIYENKTIITNMDNLPAATFFNDSLELVKSLGESVVFFLDDNNYFNTPDAVETIVQTMGRRFPGSYADSIKTEQNIDRHEYLPAHSQEMVVTGRFQHGNTFAANSSVLQHRPFDERLEQLYFMPLFHILSNQFVLAHIPSPLFRTHGFTKDLTPDLQILRNEQSG